MDDDAAGTGGSSNVGRVKVGTTTSGGSGSPKDNSTSIMSTRMTQYVCYTLSHSTIPL